jgi:hypothetical protein
MEFLWYLGGQCQRPSLWPAMTWGHWRQSLVDVGLHDVIRIDVYWTNVDDLLMWWASPNLSHADSLVPFFVTHPIASRVRDRGLVCLVRGRSKVGSLESTEPRFALVVLWIWTTSFWKVEKKEEQSSPSNGDNDHNPLVIHE